MSPILPIKKYMVDVSFTLNSKGRFEISNYSHLRANREKVLECWFRFLDKLV